MKKFISFALSLTILVSSISIFSKVTFADESIVNSVNSVLNEDHGGCRE